MRKNICIVGHVTLDRVEIAGEQPKTQPGGTALYAGITARRMGLTTAVVTRMNPADDAGALAQMRSLGIDVVAVPSPVTTRFVNTYPESNPDDRIQQVEAVADPFQPEDLDLAAHLFLFGPLTRDELSLDCLRHVRRRNDRVALDVQGLLRDVKDRVVHPFANPNILEYLKEVDILKAGREEALLMTGTRTIEDALQALAEAGPREIVITAGSKGSIVLWEEDVFTIPAVLPLAVVDATGCGDTYFAAYLSRRLLGDTPRAAGGVAAYVAAAKIAYHGPFRGEGANGIHPVKDPNPDPELHPGSRDL